MWQVVHPDWYPVLPLFSGLCGKSFTQIGTLCYLCFQVHAASRSPRLVPCVTSVFRYMWQVDTQIGTLCYLCFQVHVYVASRSPRLVPCVTSVFRFMWQVVHPDWYPVLPLFSGICGKSTPRLVPCVTSVFRYMRQVVHPDWYPVLPLFSGTCICGKSFTQIGTLCYLCFQVYVASGSPRLVPCVTSVYMYMWQVVHPDWYLVLPLVSVICAKSFTQIGTLCYLCFQVYAASLHPDWYPLLPLFSGICGKSFT